MGEEKENMPANEKQSSSEEVKEEAANSEKVKEIKQEKKAEAEPSSKEELKQEEPGKKEKQKKEKEEKSASGGKEKKKEKAKKTPAPEKKAKKKKEEKQEEKKWYVIQTLTGYEDRVKASIERNIKGSDIEGKVSSVLVPEEDIIEIRKGKRVEQKKKMFPGYIFIEMVLDESAWYTIRQTPGVARFIGNKATPIPVQDREMQRVLKQLGVRKEKIEVAFEKGETIRIISGPFRGYTGTVEEINAPKEKIKSLVNIFGRDTPVEIDFEQAEKVV